MCLIFQSCVSKNGTMYSTNCLYKNKKVRAMINAQIVLCASELRTGIFNLTHFLSHFYLNDLFPKTIE